MRLPMLSFVLLAGAQLCEIQAASAQPATSYPWCAKGTRGGAISCRYASYEQCRTTQSGIVGICIKSPYTRSAPVTPAQRRNRSVKLKGHGVGLYID
jgi:hypothetical protein